MASSKTQTPRHLRQTANVSAPFMPCSYYTAVILFLFPVERVERIILIRLSGSEWLSCSRQKLASYTEQSLLPTSLRAPCRPAVHSLAHYSSNFLPHPLLDTPQPAPHSPFRLFYAVVWVF
ncbi:hypothetical protein E2C01_002178 [Portunus trituberculatus]|uniref:Uncharacterized protein n=1 Tax=Portunus trituberculatus TaxID=210409 RepID=A0A5B7CPV0_PORTR|nr:hypothetical protein [Portunus trituberculatus]